MHENICLQCKKTCFGPVNRLVQDTCGHKKCRTCLLEDEQQCTQCEAKNCAQNGVDIEHSIGIALLDCDTNGESDSEVLVNNHTAVIQINGGYPKGQIERVESGSDGIVEPENDQETDNNIAGSSLKAPKETEGKFRIKKPDKTQKKAHNHIDIPKHIKVISDPLSYQCTICDKTFVTKTHVKYHIYCTGGAKPFKCEVCQKEFILRAQLDVHSYKHKSSKPFSCNICKKSFSVRNKLTRHSAVHSTVKSHICSVCGNAYRSKESLKIHSIIHKGERPYACKLCSAKFNNQSNLNKHVVTHSKEKAHMCDQCGKRFKQKWALSIHRRSHSRNRPHECGICHKAFVNLKDLQRHSFIHAESKAYSCSICLLSFRRSDNLRRHMKNTHPGKNGQVIKTPVTPPRVTAVDKQKTTDTSSSQPVDNPNAINVIMTASAPSSALCKAEVGLQAHQRRLENQQQAPTATSFVSLPPQSACRASNGNRSDDGAVHDGGDVNVTSSTTSSDNANANTHKRATNATTTTTPSSVINGPIKLAFKTPAFKSSYNINRNFNYIPTTQHQKSTYDMAESVNICQKILSTSGTPVAIPQPSRNIICRAEARPPTSEEICQKILDPNSEPKIHYETSFQNRKHAMIKNIKFKVPAKYTNKFRDSNNIVSDKNIINSAVNNNNNNNCNSIQDKGTTLEESVAATSVIVNNSVQFSNNMEHWRRRTSQNLGLKN